MPIYIHTDNFCSLYEIIRMFLLQMGVGAPMSIAAIVQCGRTELQIQRIPVSTVHLSAKFNLYPHKDKVSYFSA